MKRLLFVAVVAATAAAVAALTVGPRTSGASIPLRPLQTGVVDPETFPGVYADTAFARTSAAGATVARLTLDWRGVAPAGTAPNPPKDFQPTKPSDPAYNWSGFDQQVQLALDHGLEPLVTVTAAPRWGTKADPTAGGLRRPDPKQYAAFALAAARRYSGAFEELPRVRYWQAWNEPNHVGQAPLKAGAAEWYRALVNAFAGSIHRARSDNSVIAGGTSPFTTTTAVGPLLFMRRVLCMRSASPAVSSCGAKLHFDIWSTNPYTSGGPTHHANGNEDVSIGDLPEMRALLTAAIRTGHVVTAQRVRFWVTEFSWDTSPPDPQAVPIKLQTRWAAEALYRMWNAGVSLVVWWRLRDDPLRTSFYQSGLFFRGVNVKHDRAKSTFFAFRFPFVAFPQGDRIFVWTRTPGGIPGRVAVQQSSASGWKELATLETNRFGIASGYVRSTLGGPLRGRLAVGGDTSIPFSLQSPPDHFYYPFGS